MKYKWIEKEMTYDGTQLRSGFAPKLAQSEPDCMIAFIGPANVPIENMVDMEDVEANEHIYSELMLHFLIEHKTKDLPLGVARQRMLCAITADILMENKNAKNIRRLGDDLYDEDKKLSVSIATNSPNTTCIHFAMNIKSENTPVKTIGLCDYEIDPKSLAKKIMTAYTEEIESMNKAVNKVKFVT